MMLQAHLSIFILILHIASSSPINLAKNLDSLANQRRQWDTTCSYWRWSKCRGKARNQKKTDESRFRKKNILKKDELEEEGKMGDLELMSSLMVDRDEPRKFPPKRNLADQEFQTLYWRET